MRESPGASDADGSAPLDIGGVAVKRAVLAELLPDPARFERHRADALAVDAAMQANGGQVPTWVEDWPQTRIEAVIATLNEIGQLREHVVRAASAAGQGQGAPAPVPDAGDFRRSKP